MAETIRQIESHIDRSRAELGSHLRELGARVEAATDWREHVRARPFLAIGMAVAGGVVLAQASRTRVARMAVDDLPAPMPRRRGTSIDARGQARDLWDNVANAMIALAATRLTRYIGGLLPGFDDEYRRVVRTRVHDRSLDRTIEDSFPASDPPSTNPDPAPAASRW